MCPIIYNSSKYLTHQVHFHIFTNLLLSLSLIPTFLIWTPTSVNSVNSHGNRGKCHYIRIIASLPNQIKGEYFKLKITSLRVWTFLSSTKAWVSPSLSTGPLWQEIDRFHYNINSRSHMQLIFHICWTFLPLISDGIQMSTWEQHYWNLILCHTHFLKIPLN